MDDMEGARSGSEHSAALESVSKRGPPKRSNPKRGTARPVRENVKKGGRPRDRSSNGESDDSDVESSFDCHLNEVLREKAANCNLSVKNVKTILKHVITNEAVLKMIRETLRDEGEWESGGEDDKEDSALQFYSPKMTRAKLKELMRNRRPGLGNPQVPAVLDGSDGSMTLLAKEFKDEESSSDEEYKPDEHHESDDESQTSVSELGSPGAGTPSTPKSVGLRSQVLQREHVRSLAKETPNSTGNLTPSDDRDEPTFIDPANPARKSLEFSPVSSQNEDGISLRTRSRHPLKDTTVESLELSFIPPDITEDMYETEVDNPDWAEFLRDFVLCPPNAGDGNDDDEADPEYNVLEEEECVDPYEKLHDNRVRVSKKELNDLMAELFEDECFLNFPDPQPAMQEWYASVGQSQVPLEGDSMDPVAEECSSDATSVTRSSEDDEVVDETPAKFAHEDYGRISEQMARHVQLLAQTYVFASNVPCLEEIRQGCRDMLSELESVLPTLPPSEPEETIRQIGETISTEQTCSARFVVVPNLRPALKELLCDHMDSTMDVKSPRRVRVLESAAAKLGLPWRTAERIMSSGALLFPDMLPPEVLRCGTITKQRSDRCLCERRKWKVTPTFISAEDKLLAVALEEFIVKLKAKKVVVPHASLFDDTRGRQKYPSDAFNLVHRYVMPARSVKQLRLRVKNMVSTKRSEESNMLTSYLTTGCLEREPVTITWLSVGMGMTPPYCLPEDSFPLPWREVVHELKIKAGLEKNVAVPFDEDLEEEEEKKISTSPLPSLFQEPAVEKVTPFLTSPKTAFENGASFLAFPKEQLLLIPACNMVYILPHPPPWSREYIVNMMHSSVQNDGGLADEGRSNDESGLAEGEPGFQIERNEEPSAPDDQAPTQQTSRPSIDLKAIVLQTVATPKSQKYLDLGNDSSQPFMPDAEEPDRVPLFEARIAAASMSEETNVASCAEESVPNAEKVAGEEPVAEDDEGKDADEALSKQKLVEMDTGRAPNPLKDLMLASTTIKKPPRKTKKMRDVEASMKLLADEDPEAREQREAQYVTEYLLRLHSTLAVDGKESVYDEFYVLMNEFDDSASLAARVSLYHRIENLLEGYPDLISEFILFLGDDCAFALGRHEEFSFMLGLREFLRSVNIHFGSQPLHVQKIARAMQQIATGKEDDITKENVKNAVLPLLKGSSHLIDLFTNLLRCDPPPESLFFDSDYEEVNLCGEDSGGSSTDEAQDEQPDQAPPTPPAEEKPPGEHLFDFKRPAEDPEPTHEEVRVAGDEDDDPYGGCLCPCKCHDTEDAKLKARLRHCVPCGLKFVDGGAYVKVGKTLRPAKISYIYRPPISVTSAPDPPEAEEPIDQDLFSENATSGSTSPSLVKASRPARVSPSCRGPKKSSMPKEYTNMRLATEGGSVSFGASSSEEVPQKQTRWSSVIPGKENKSDTRKRKADGETQVPSYSIPEDTGENRMAGTAPKVKKAADIPSNAPPSEESAVEEEALARVMFENQPDLPTSMPDLSMATSNELLQTPAKPPVITCILEPPPSVAFPDFSTMSLSDFTPAPPQLAGSNVSTACSDVLETPRVEHR